MSAAAASAAAATAAAAPAETTEPTEAAAVQTTEKTESTRPVVKETFEELELEFTDNKLEKVVLDTVAVLRLIKDCMDAQPDISTGTLLGLDNGSTLEVTNSYPIPLVDADPETEGENSEDSFSETVLRCYREANIDTTEVGWYTTSYGDSVFLAPETVSAQYDWQKRNPKSVMLVFDPFRTVLEGTCGSRPLALHAYRLTPEFFALYKKGAFTVERIRAAGVSCKNIFQEVPIALRTPSSRRTAPCSTRPCRPSSSAPSRTSSTSSTRWRPSRRASPSTSAS